MDASTPELSKVHEDWHDHLDFNTAINLLRKIKEGNEEFAPNLEEVFNVFATSPKNVKVVIVGQDPYPTSGDANGLAFSVNRSERLPKSLQNIFKELANDLQTPLRTSGDLSDWQCQGVFLINRILTVPIGRANGHSNLGWESFTKEAISVLAANGAVGLLMGKEAGKLAKLFDRCVVVAHPSPLSAYRGFFGSRPFTQVNNLLSAPIKW